VALASLGAAERDQRPDARTFFAKREVTLDRPLFDAILVRQIVIATLFRFVVNVKFYFLISY
jgi:hypothetical protein